MTTTTRTSLEPRWSALFFGGAIVSCALGLGVLRDGAADVARGLFFVFLMATIVVILRRATREVP
jgi:uncharacterized membrane protein YtjA (UPF0391 family)